MPMVIMHRVSLQDGLARHRLPLTWNFGIYPRSSPSTGTSVPPLVRLRPASTTGLTLLIGYPMAYTIAFRGGRFKTPLLLLVILPFFASFVIRTLTWRMILSDNGFVLRHAQGRSACSTQGFHFLATPASVIFGLTYNFLPFMILPLYVALEKIDRAPDRGRDRPVRQPRPGVLRVTLPLSLPGVFAGSLLTFIPAMGDFINAEVIGAGNPRCDDRQRHPAQVPQQQRLPGGRGPRLRAGGA